jgi:hypothetical protein
MGSVTINLSRLACDKSKGEMAGAMDTLAGMVVN